MSGEDVLRELCRLTDRVMPDRHLMAAASAATISANLLDRDEDATPRRVVARLGELASAGLASRGPAVRRLASGRLKSYSRCTWSPTPRGREVNRILDRIRPGRGGTFVPMSEAGITTAESIALRPMRYAAKKNAAV